MTYERLKIDFSHCRIPPTTDNRASRSYQARSLRLFPSLLEQTSVVNRLDFVAAL